MAAFCPRPSWEHPHLTVSAMPQFLHASHSFTSPGERVCVCECKPDLNCDYLKDRDIGFASFGLLLIFTFIGIVHSKKQISLHLQNIQCFNCFVHMMKISRVWSPSFQNLILQHWHCYWMESKQHWTEKKMTLLSSVELLHSWTLHSYWTELNQYRAE